MKRRSVKIDKIRLDGGTQPRAGIITALVADYAATIDAGNADFPPAIVFFDGVDYWLADGFHRWHATNNLGISSLYCEIHEGTVEDARWYSYAANQAHGQRRSNADKARAVKAALLHPKGAGLSDSQIAEHVGVSHATVIKYRAELVAACQIDKLTERTGKDGKTYNTTNIGNGSPASGARGQPITSEALASELARVPEDERQEVLDLATEKAGDKPLTTAIIKRAIREWNTSSDYPPPREYEPCEEDDEEYEEEAIECESEPVTDHHAEWLAESAGELLEAVEDPKLVPDFLLCLSAVVLSATSIKPLSDFLSGTVAMLGESHPSVAATRLENKAEALRSE